MAKFQGIRVATDDSPIELTNSDAVTVNVQNETSGRIRIRGTSSATLPSIADFNTFSYSLSSGQSASINLVESFKGINNPVRLHALPDKAGNIIVDHD